MFVAGGNATDVKLNRCYDSYDMMSSLDRQYVRQLNEDKSTGTDLFRWILCYFLECWPILLFFLQVDSKNPKLRNCSKGRIRTRALSIENPAFYH